MDNIEEKSDSTVLASARALGSYGTIHEVDRKALAAIHQSLKYTIVPGNAMRLLIKGLEDGFPTSESFQSIYDAALAANIAPHNCTSRIPSISYDSNRERYVDYIQTKLAVRSVQH